MSNFYDLIHYIQIRIDETHNLLSSISLYFKRKLGSFYSIFLYPFVLSFFILIGIINSAEEVNLIRTEKKDITNNESIIINNITNNETLKNISISHHHKIDPTDSIISSVLVALTTFFVAFCVLQICRIVRALSIQVNRNRRADRINQLFQIIGDGDSILALNNPTLQARLRLALMRRELSANDYEVLQMLDEGVGNRRGRGASQEVISNLPLHTFSSSKGKQKLNGNVLEVQEEAPELPEEPSATCPICLGEFTDGEELRTLPCLHLFHRECSDQWLQQRALCPVCKQSIISLE